MRRLLATSLLVLSASGWGQDTAAPRTAETAAAPAQKRRVIRLDAVKVEGRIQKPQAFYILQRSNLSFDELNRAESFLPRIEQALDKDPF